MAIQHEIDSRSDLTATHEPTAEDRAASRQSLRARKAHERVEKARLEREVSTLRLAGVSYDKIAAELKLADGKSAERIWKRVLRELRMPNLEEAKRVHVARLEQLYFNLQKKEGGMKEGKPRAVEVGLQLLDQEAKLLGSYPAPNVNLPAQNVSVTVVDRVEFIALPESTRQQLDLPRRVTVETGADAPGVDGPTREDSGGGGRDRDGQDVVRPDLDVGPAT